METEDDETKEQKGTNGLEGDPTLGMLATVWSEEAAGSVTWDWPLGC